jgi:hypothetical protein
MSEISHDQGIRVGFRDMRGALGASTAQLAWISDASALAGHRAVRFAAANLTVSVLCRTTRDPYAYLSDRIGALAGVQTVDTALVLRRVKVFT